jgi:hypothetical protein
MAVLLQRFAVPGLYMIALLVPAVVMWAAAALARGVVVVDSTRLICWLTAASLAGILMLVQSRVVVVSRVSVSSWALVFVVWLPFVLRLTQRGVPAYMAMLRHITTITTALGVASIAMIGIQLAGVPYEDWFAQIVPKSLQLHGFNTSYPIEFGSPIYKSNAFIGLEPSIVSSLLGVGALAAILTSAPTWKFVVLIAGLVATVALSGMIIVFIGILVMILAPGSRRLAARYAAIFVLAALAGWFTDVGKLVFERVGEFNSDSSSTSLRVFEPYRILLPQWTQHLAGAVLGYGPGSSQDLANETNIESLLVTTPAKIFFEYGLLGGLVLGGFVLVCFWGAPSRTFSISLLASIWLFQAGLATVVIVLPVLVTLTLWSPRIGKPIESPRLGGASTPDLLQRRSDSIEPRSRLHDWTTPRLGPTAELGLEQRM